jgi:hypothetical protein
MFNVRPDEFWPWIRFEPPSDDPPGFRVAADGSIRGAGDSDLGLRGYRSSADTMLPADRGFGVYHSGGDGGNLSDLITSPMTGTEPIPSLVGASQQPHAAAPLFPQMTTPQPLWPSLQGYGGDFGTLPETPVPGFHVEPPTNNPPGFRVGSDGSVQDTLPDNSKIMSFGYDPQADAISSVSGNARRPSSPLEDNVYPALYGAYDPISATALLRGPVQEAVDQIKRIYAGVGRSSLHRFERQGQSPDPVMRLTGSVDSEVSPTIGDAFDPQDIVPANNRLPPPSGKGPNNPTGSKQTPGSTSGSQQPTLKRPADAPPDTGEHAAAAEAAAQQRAASYTTHREHLQQLDPDNPLLKLEPAPGVTPDQATVDRYGTEVRRIVREKVDRTVEGLSAKHLRTKIDCQNHPR